MRVRAARSLEPVEMLSSWLCVTGVVLLGCGASDKVPPAPVIEAEQSQTASLSRRRVELPEHEHVGVLVTERGRDTVPVALVVTKTDVSCEPGQTLVCPNGGVPMRAGGPPLSMQCRKGPDGVFRFARSDCATPLVVAFDEAPVHFTTPGGAFPVGPYARTEWVSGETPWLALDRDGSGCIETEEELFRFDRLAALDDDHDGRIDRRDAAYTMLTLWSDHDQDRRCSAGEVIGLEQAGIVAMDLDYATPPPTELSFGSHEGEHAGLVFRDGRRGRLVDVYLAPMP